jgi:hypothetical protein
MMFASKFAFAALCATMTASVEGSSFLQPIPQHLADRVSEQDIQTSFLEEIEASLGSGIAAKRISDIKAILGPMVAALPKNEHGNLDHVTVRYALHRVFIQRHGWSIKGLDPTGDSWNASSPTGILADQVPSYIQNLFEQRLGGRGLGLNELAVFAATIEHLIHNEAIGRLGSAMNLQDLLPTASMTTADADEVLDMYMMEYILGEHARNLTAKKAQRLVKQMPKIFLAWPETQVFVREVRHNTTNVFGKGSEVDFAILAKVAETVGEKFGKFQDAECKGMKATLMNIEDRGTGRVHLSDFYGPASKQADGSWQFQESIAYLRQLGALDESNPDEPRVMIPNYLTSQTNCIASSDYYSVCCLNECEDLSAHLEQEIAAHEATPARIADLISALASSTVSAPRTLSATLRSRLEDIAVEHGGLVQLHSRLFSQWMHHAYPRECPYPHVAGTTNQVSAKQWEKESGIGASATHEELTQFTAESNSTSDKLQEVEDLHDLMMWTSEEKLLVCRPPSASLPGKGSSRIVAGLMNIALFIAMTSIMFGLVRTTLTAKGTEEVPQKFMV